MIPWCETLHDGLAILEVYQVPDTGHMALIGCWRSLAVMVELVWNQANDFGQHILFEPSFRLSSLRNSIKQQKLSKYQYVNELMERLYK